MHEPFFMTPLAVLALGLLLPAVIRVPVYPSKGHIFHSHPVYMQCKRLERSSLDGKGKKHNKPFFALMFVRKALSAQHRSSRVLPGDPSVALYTVRS